MSVSVSVSVPVISCLDSRYHEETKSLLNICDEFAYYRNRVHVEIKYFTKLTGIPLHYDALRDFTHSDYETILEKEHTLRHDVKAIEYFIKELPEIKATGKSHLIHLGLTSQDICSLGFMMCFRDSINIFMKEIAAFNSLLMTRLINIPDAGNIYMLGFTHGQPATPTKFSKEMRIYFDRLQNIHNELIKLFANSLTVKFGGATGEMNAMKFILPDVNWQQWCDKFVTEFNSDTGESSYFSYSRFNRTLHTNQCDNYDSVITVLYCLRRYLLVLEHLRGNIWLYIHREYLVQIVVNTEIGSSTMPNKVNPIDLENAKTAIELGKRMIDGVADILNETSYQRDISDSSALRNVATIFGYILVAINKMKKGISRLSVNTLKIAQELNDHPEVILEGIQTYLKYHCGIGDAYELTKELSHGKKLDLASIAAFIDSLDIGDEHKEKLKTLRPDNYLGMHSHFNL